MVLVDTKGKKYTVVEKVGRSSLTDHESRLHEYRQSLTRISLTDGRELKPAGEGRFKIVGSAEILTLVDE
jgi:hypothetical protein